MTAENPNTVWAHAIVEELVATGIQEVCIAPGSRSTPLTLACADHDAMTIYSVLDERSAGYFAVGRARYTGTPTPVVTTSGTATANLHPAVMEADTGRVPTIILTADRPPERKDSGANQTVDQTNLYGGAVRWFHTPGLPDDDPTALRALRTMVHRAVTAATDPPAGPVHLNLPFRKPLEPADDPNTPVEGSGLDEQAGRAAPYLDVSVGEPTLAPDRLQSVATRLDGADRPLIVCGPLPDWRTPQPDIAALGAALNAPILADPLSGLRFGSPVEDATVIGHYDAYLTDAVTDDWTAPDTVIRFGASPTSKRLRQYLADADTTQLLVDPAGEWREAEFSATDLLVAAPGPTAADLADAVTDTGRDQWHTHWARTDATTTQAVASLPYFEGKILSTVVETVPPESVVFVSNSTPIRDFDRFCPPAVKPLTTVGNRGASGIDGITSTALGAGSATDDDLVLVTGDLAFYHDMNGLLAIDRCNVEVTIVLINNDGGGIFHRLPISDYEPPFTDQFRTPHNLDFDPVGDLYDFEYTRARNESALTEELERALSNTGSTVIETPTDAGESHAIRERFTDQLVDRLD